MRVDGNRGTSEDVESGRGESELTVRVDGGMSELTVRVDGGMSELTGG